MEDAATVVRACFSWGDAAGALAAAEAAATLEDRLPASWHPLWLLALGRAHYFVGDHDAAKPFLQWAVSSGHHVERPLLAAIAQGYLARIELAATTSRLAERGARAAWQAVESRDLADQPAAGTAFTSRWEPCSLGSGGPRRPATCSSAARPPTPARRRPGDRRCAARLRARAEGARVAHVGAGPRRGGTAAPRGLRRPRRCRRRARGGRALADPGSSADRRRSELTERELEVLRYLAEGSPKRDIGTALFLSYNTIHSHTKSIYQKLRVSSRDAAVARAPRARRALAGESLTSLRSIA